MSQPPTVPSALTAEELLYPSLPDKQTELVRGRLIVREPSGYRHSVVALKIARLIADYVDDHGLGTVVGAETGFKLFSNPDTVRAADAAGDGSVDLLANQDALSGEDVLPGFSCSLEDIW